MKETGMYLTFPEGKSHIEVEWPDGKKTPACWKNIDEWDSDPRPTKEPVRPVCKVCQRVLMSRRSS